MSVWFKDAQWLLQIAPAAKLRVQGPVVIEDDYFRDFFLIQGWSPDGYYLSIHNALPIKVIIASDR